MCKINNAIAVVFMATAVVLFGCKEQAAAPAVQSIAAAADESAEPTGPRIEFDETFHDFGEIDDSETVRHEFAFRNAGDEPLVILDIKSSGSGPRATRSMPPVEPGGQGVIPVKFNPNGRTGRQAKSIRVESNDPNNQITNLRIAADIFALVSVEPKVFRFDQVEAGHSKTITGKVRVRGEEFALTGIEVDGPYATAKVVSEEPLLLTKSPGTYYTIEVTVHADAPLGWHDRRVIIRTDNPDQPIFEAPLWANILGPIEIQPAKLPLGVVRSGKEFRRELRLVSRSGEPFEITGWRIESDAEGLDIRCEPRTDPAAPAQPIIEITVMGTGPEQIGKLEGNIVIETSADSRPINIPFHFVVRPV